MRPVIWAACACALLAGLGRLVAPPAVPELNGPTETPKSSVARLLAPCPAGQLPDGRVCVPVPSDPSRGGIGLLTEQRSHRDPAGHWQVYDQIPRRPDRPEAYTSYRYPVPTLDRDRPVTSGYDLHLPDPAQRRGPGLPKGHGGVDLPQKRGTEVRLLALENQAADAEVVYVGQLFGNTVVTRHSLREAGQLRDYLVLHGHLEESAAELRVGQSVPASTLLGTVGDSGSPGAVHLHLEIRRVRSRVAARKLITRELTDNAYTVVCDPRNVLPLRAKN